MRSIPMLSIAAFVLVSPGAFADAGHASQLSVRYQPWSPQADALGRVPLKRGAPEQPPPMGAGEAPGQMPGWPIDYALSRPEEGAVLVEADGDAQTEILYSTGKVVHLLNADGTELAGWPKTITTGSRLSSGPAFGDVDGDGEGEVVVCSDNWPNGSIGWTYAYDTDGALLPGFPAITNGDHSRSPTVSDLDGDGDHEIIVGERDWPGGAVYVIDGDGSFLPGWPQALNHVPASSAGAADVDGDGMKEVVYESYESVYVWKIDGTRVDGFPWTPPTGDVFSYSAPTFADVDDDGLLEIAVGGHSLSADSHLFLLNGDGTQLPGWPKATDWWIYAPPTFADLDGDGDLEVLVGDQVLSGSPTNSVYGWHHDGTPVAGFPIGPVWAINAQVAVADLDGDGDPELVWDDNTTDASGRGKLLGYHHTGVPIEGWPLETDGTTFFNTVAIDDLDGDGDLEMWAASGTVSSPFETTAYLYDFVDQVQRSAVQMPMFQYGPGRDGLMPQGTPSVPGDVDGDGDVDFSDLVALLSDWGPCPAPPAECPADLDGNGSVGFSDLLEVLNNWS